MNNRKYPKVIIEDAVYEKGKNYLELIRKKLIILVMTVYLKKE